MTEAGRRCNKLTSERMLLLNALARVLLSCCFAVAATGSFAAMPGRPSVTMVTPGQERKWLHDDFTASARFELRAGHVVVWEPVGGEAPGPLVEFAGLLDDEAARVLGELLRKGRMHTLSLTGPGGLVEPTLKLGRAVRAKGVSTLVETGRGCYSACALLFLAGDRRLVGTDPKELSRVSAAVGFHAPYTLGPDGTARHLQDVKTSSSCAYIRQMVLASAAAELCDYTLATKGMATFSLAEGKRLHIYTDSVSEVIAQWADSVIEASTPDEKQWVNCERYRLFIESNNHWRTSNDPNKYLYPCSERLAEQAPTPQSRFAELAKVARAKELGAILAREIAEGGHQMVANHLATGMSPEDKYLIDCRRSAAWLRLEGKMTDFMTPQSPQPFAAEYLAWHRVCVGRVTFHTAKGRYIEGIGYVEPHLMDLVLSRMATSQGAAWTLPEPQPVK